jgi:hypothetical protein
MTLLTTIFSNILEVGEICHEMKIWGLYAHSLDKLRYTKPFKWIPAADTAFKAFNAVSAAGVHLNGLV